VISTELAREVPGLAAPRLPDALAIPRQPPALRALREGLGRTRDRAPRVRRFQEDAACPLFLVSLKAGGLGLNLTAADTVYLLDPWWNPAVESQAIDRTHRIGQTKPVNAYRLVAKDTIEEKILALQERKRKLADAVISADASVLRSLTREDLEMLLG
jgi:SNF2 family DNA or RNA helicase